VSDVPVRGDVVAALRAGGVVLLPTDTVYGLAVATAVPTAVAQLFALKGRGRDVPIAVLVADAAQAWELAAPPVPAAAIGLGEKWWPGPLTLVVARAPGWGVDIGGSGGTVGLRCPDDAMVRELCRAVGPLATTSANRHGEPTPPSAAEAAVAVGHSGLVVDGGRLAGAPSTVVDCTVSPPRVLREGAVPAAALVA
jgi:tRNA threonylcarbamoyl adenosine modification protein (Sua5/YciO/YrdC/YwlC family)